MASKLKNYYKINQILPIYFNNKHKENYEMLQYFFDINQPIFIVNKYKLHIKFQWITG